MDKKDEDKKDELFNEYKMLREEIMEADKLKYQMFGFVMTAVAAIIATGFSSPADPHLRATVFLVSYVFTIPAYQNSWINRRRVWRITTYMRVFLEPKFVHTNWETRLFKFEKLESAKPVGWRRKVLSPFFYNERSIYILLTIVVTGAIAFTLIQHFILFRCDSHYVLTQFHKQLYIVVVYIAIFAILAICVIWHLARKVWEKKPRRSHQALLALFLTVWKKKPRKSRLALLTLFWEKELRRSYLALPILFITLVIMCILFQGVVVIWNAPIEHYKLRHIWALIVAIVTTCIIGCLLFNVQKSEAELTRIGEVVKGYDEQWDYIKKKETPLE